MKQPITNTYILKDILQIDRKYKHDRPDCMCNFFTVTLDPKNLIHPL